MKISRDGWLPQFEPVGSLGPWLVRLGGFKVILQQSSFPMQAVTMVNASIGAWATSHSLRSTFNHNPWLFAGVVTAALSAWLLLYVTVIYPGEQGFNQGQSQRSERSPLKRDTEAILEKLEQREPATDGGRLRCPHCGRITTQEDTQ